LISSGGQIALCQGANSITNIRKIFGIKIKSPGFLGLFFGVGVGGAGAIYFLTRVVPFAYCKH